MSESKATYRGKYKCSLCGDVSYSFHTMTMRTDTKDGPGIPFSVFIPCMKCWSEHKSKYGMKYLMYAEEVKTDAGY